MEQLRSVKNVGKGKLGTTESYRFRSGAVVHEVVTGGALHALKGVGSHAFYRWLVIVRMATKVFALAAEIKTARSESAQSGANTKGMQEGAREPR